MLKRLVILAVREIRLSQLTISILVSFCYVYLLLYKGFSSDLYFLKIAHLLGRGSYFCESN